VVQSNQNRTLLPALPLRFPPLFLAPNAVERKTPKGCCLAGFVLSQSVYRRVLASGHRRASLGLKTCFFLAHGVTRLVLSAHRKEKGSSQLKLKEKQMGSAGRKPVPNGDGKLLVGKQRRMEAIKGGQVARVGNDHCGDKSLGSAQRS